MEGASPQEIVPNPVTELSELYSRMLFLSLTEKRQCQEHSSFTTHRVRKVSYDTKRPYQ